jgi:hypothetical protein
MANQGSDRRAVLEMLAKAAAVSQFPGFSRWAFGQGHDHAERPAMYAPSYFTAPEYHTIDVLTDLIIPKDESPGAREAGVSEFIDFMAAHGEKEIQQPMRDALRWLDAQANGSFTALPADRQIEILKRASQRDSQGTSEGHAFFQLIRRYTVMGYYTSRVGLKELDYPGLRLYSESPACPHTNDPEHRHLPAPKV